MRTNLEHSFEYCHKGRPLTGHNLHHFQSIFSLKIDDKGVKTRGENRKEIASSQDTEMSSTLTVDSILKKRNQLKKLERNFKAYILKRMQECPETACTTNLPAEDLLQHIVDAHKIPKHIVLFEMYDEVKVDLHDLENEKSNGILALFVAISFNENNKVSDPTIMPLMVMAAKIKPCGSPVFTQLEEGPLTTPDLQLTCPGELVMIWICGHLQTISALIRVKTMHNVTNEFTGNVHSFAEINSDPSVVFTRGNCLLIPARNITQLTQNGKIPLNVQVKLSAPEE